MKKILASLAFVLVFALPGGAQSVCALNTTSVGWTWSCPQLSMSWAKINLISKLDVADLASDGNNCTGGANCQTQITNKYGGTNAAWMAAMNARMLSLGFTGAGYYSYLFSSSHPSGGLPYEVFEQFRIRRNPRQRRHRPGRTFSCERRRVDCQQSWDALCARVHGDDARSLRC